MRVFHLTAISADRLDGLVVEATMGNFLGTMNNEQILAIRGEGHGKNTQENSLITGWLSSQVSRFVSRLQKTSVLLKGYNYEYRYDIIGIWTLRHDRCV